MPPRASPRPPLRAALALALLASACSTTRVSVSRVWSEKDLAKDRYEKVMVLVVVPNENRRETAEDRIVAALSRQKANAVRSWDALSADDLADRDRVAAAVAKLGADAVLAVRVTGRETKVEEHVGREEWVPVGTGIDYYGYVTTAYGLYRKPDSSELRTITIETTLWDVASRRMVWACQSDSRSANQTLTTAEVADDYAAVVTTKVVPYLRRR